MKSKYVGPECNSCGHSAEGVLVKKFPGDEQAQAIFNTPPPECECVCHDAWKIVNGVALPVRL